MSNICIADHKNEVTQMILSNEGKTGLDRTRDPRKSIGTKKSINKPSGSSSDRVSLDDLTLLNLESSVRNRRSRYSGSVFDKENFSVENVTSAEIKQKISGRSTARLSAKDTNVFKFSVIEQEVEIPSICVVQDDLEQDEIDDVFLEESSESHKESNTLLLTPSTASSVRRSSCSSQGHFIHLRGSISSPRVSQGISCSTPDKIRLETSGLGVNKLVLGRGAYGTVVLGRWKGVKVAIKVMEKEDGDKSTRRRKSLEGELNASCMNHENIVKIYDVRAAEHKNAIIIMEYVGSRNLHRLLSTPEKHLPAQWLLGCGLQVASALQHCHSRGVVHLDVKPANILVTSTGQCKLGDFGCSVSLDGSKLAIGSSLVGTPGYQAPEFLRGSVPAPACDIYSLGIMLWQLDSREIPFQGVHAQTVIFRVVSAGVRPAPPPRHLAYVGRKDFSLLYHRCWHQDHTQRPPAAKVDEELGRIVKLLNPTKLNADFATHNQREFSGSQDLRTKTHVSNSTLKVPMKRMSNLRV